MPGVWLDLMKEIKRNKVRRLWRALNVRIKSFHGDSKTVPAVIFEHTYSRVIDVTTWVRQVCVGSTEREGLTEIV
jgi:hypothetical protein